MTLTGCNLKKSYRYNGNVVFIYKEKLYEIEGKYLAEDMYNQVYILFDSIKINKTEIKSLAVELPDDIYEPYDDGFYNEEDYEDEYEYLYDEYRSLKGDNETIKITERYIKDNFKVFK